MLFRERPASAGFRAYFGHESQIHDHGNHGQAIIPYRPYSWRTLSRESIEFQPSLNSNSGDFLLKAAEQGLGIARLPDFISEKVFASGSLVPILPNAAVRLWGIYLLHAEDRRLNRRMRLFAEEIEAACLNIGIETAGR